LEVYAYFNNDANTRAPGNAKMFIEMIGARPARKKTPRKAVVAA